MSHAGVTLNLDEFSCGWMKRDSLALLLGRRRSGKSYALRQIAYELRFRRMVAFAGGYDAATMLATYIPDTYVHYGFEEDRAMAILFEQKQRHIKHELEASLDADFAFFIDDLAYDQKAMRCKTMDELAKNGRHEETFVAVTAQYCMDVAPGVRCNIDYLMVYKEMTHKNRKAMYTEYFGIVETLKLFNDILNMTTNKYCALVLDSTESVSGLEDCLMWFRSTFDLPKFEVGDEVYRAFHLLYYKDPTAKLRKSIEGQMAEQRLSKLQSASGRTDDDDEGDAVKRPVRAKRPERVNKPSTGVHVKMIPRELTPAEKEALQEADAKARAAERRTVEVRTAELHAAELRSAELRASEAHAAEVLAAEVLATEVLAAEVLAAEVLAAEVLATEVLAAEVFAEESCAEESVTLENANIMHHMTDNLENAVDESNKKLNEKGSLLLQSHKSVATHCQKLRAEYPTYKRVTASTSTSHETHYSSKFLRKNMMMDTLDLLR
jgi:hypothetical protein